MDTKFPVFENLKLSHKETFERVMSGFPPYSDHNFAGLWTYNVDDDVQFSTFNNNIVLLSKDYLTRKRFITFVGLNNLEETIKTLLDFSKQELNNPELRLIPEEIVNHLNPDFVKHLNILEDHANHDYILDVDKTISLTGAGLHSVRQKLNQFESLHPNVKFKLIDLKNPQILDVFYEWEKQRNKSRAETQVELTAITRCIECSNSFNFLSIGAFDGQKLIGFTVNEGLNDGYYIGHFGKYLPEYKGLFQILEVETAKVMKSLGYKYMNYEQDLGEPGLRTLKMSWEPAFMLKKYIIFYK